MLKKIFVTSIFSFIFYQNIFMICFFFKFIKHGGRAYTCSSLKIMIPDPHWFINVWAKLSKFMVSWHSLFHLTVVYFRKHLCVGRFYLYIHTHAHTHTHTSQDFVSIIIVTWIKECQHCLHMNWALNMFKVPLA